MFSRPSQYADFKKVGFRPWALFPGEIFNKNDKSGEQVSGAF